MDTSRRSFLKFGMTGAAALAMPRLTVAADTPAFAKGLKRLPGLLDDAKIVRSAQAEKGTAASFFIDDVIWVMRDLSRQRPKSMWDNPFMATFRECHEKYGLKMQLNLFYRTDFFYGLDEFTLADMTDAYREEFQASKDWFKLGFHSLQEFPDYPWINISYEDTDRLYRRIKGEIDRFAGPGVFTTALVPHWCPMSKDGVKALADNGVKIMQCTLGPRYEYDGDRNRLPYGHGLKLEQNRKPETAIFWRDSRNKDILSSICSYNHMSEAQAAKTENSFNFLLDPDTGMRMKGMFCDAPCLNLCTPATLRSDTEALIGREYLIFSNHEQYFYKDYLAYQPDYAEKIRIMCEMVAKDNRRFILMEELV